MFCTKCGTPISNGALFCTKCGTQQADCSTNIAQTQPTAPQQPVIPMHIQQPAQGDYYNTHQNNQADAGYEAANNYQYPYYSPLPKYKKHSKATFVIIGIACVIFSIIVISIAGSCLSSISSRNSYSQNNTTVSTPHTTPEPVQLLYSFNEVIQKSPSYFYDGDNRSNTCVESQELNYYGEVSISNEVIFRGQVVHLPVETFALFIVGGDSDAITLESSYINSNGDMNYTFSGYTVRGEIDHSKRIIFDLDGKSVFAGPAVISNRHHVLRGISYSYIAFVNRDRREVEYDVKLLSIVLTQEQAIQYAQDGTLPEFLNGLTVVGLDEIIKAPR